MGEALPPRAKPTASRRKSAQNTAPAKSPRANGSKPLSIRVESLSEFNEYKKILLVGDSGVGKTVLAGGAPRGIFISTEKGTVSAKRFGSDAKLIRVANWKQLEQALNYVEEHADEYDWAMVDSLPKMQRMLLRHLLDANLEEGRKGADIDVPQIQDHQKWQNMFTRFYDRLNEMPINVIYTSTPMRVETEDDEGDPIDIVLPAIQGKAKEGYAIAQYICAEVDCLWFLTMERRSGKNQRVLITQKRPPYFAKDRYAALPGRVVLPDDDPTLMGRLLARLDSGEVSAEASASEDEDDRPPGPEADEPEDDDDGPEETPPPRRKPKPSQAGSKQSTARKRTGRKPTPAPEEDDDDDIDLDGDDDADDGYDHNNE